jgi:hypothetical protein
MAFPGRPLRGRTLTSILLSLKSFMFPLHVQKHLSPDIKITVQTREPSGDYYTD